jgi:hypothetical protein
MIAATMECRRFRTKRSSIKCAGSRTWSRHWPQANALSAVLWAQGPMQTHRRNSQVPATSHSERVWDTKFPDRLGPNTLSRTNNVEDGFDTQWPSCCVYVTHVVACAVRLLISVAVSSAVRRCGMGLFSTFEYSVRCLSAFLPQFVPPGAIPPGASPWIAAVAVSSSRSADSGVFSPARGHLQG